MHPDKVSLLHSVWMQHFGGLFALEELVSMLQERSSDLWQCEEQH